MGQFIGTIGIEPAGGKFWRTNKPLSYITDENERIDIPVGFKFDGASTPKFAWSIIGHPLDQEYLAAVCLHDYLYFIQKYSRRKSDKIFSDAMKVLKVIRWKRRTMYLAVRAFGWKAWRKHRKV